MNKLTLPDISAKSDVRVSYNINGREFMFHFKWCESFCTVDIYFIENNVNNYLVQGFPLTLGTNLIARCGDLLSGFLIFCSKYGKSVESAQDNFHTDYYFLYLEE